MNDDLKCRICGKLKSQDRHFNVKNLLCNRHNLQYRNHGYFLDNDLIINKERVYWSEEDKQKVEELYAQGLLIDEIAKELNRTKAGVQHIADQLHLSEKYMRKNNIHFKAIYQDYGWCYEHYINLGQSHQEMADELGVTKRVIQKWCVEIHGINGDTFRKYKKLNEIQRQIIIAGTLGDGHIDRRPDQPMYIECHAIDEKDYLFWKYGYLKDLCNNPPKYYKETTTSFGSDKQYLCKPHYRINTRILDDLYEIRSMSRLDKIKSLTELQLCLLLLDDGSRGNLWELCVAEWSDDEVEELLCVCMNKYLIRFNRHKDKRYIMFDAISSNRIDEMILNNLPHDLDIIQKKIINNDKIRELKNSHYVITDNKKIGLATYSKSKHIPYDVLKDIVWNMNLPFNEISENELLSLPEVAKYAVQQLP